MYKVRYRRTTVLLPFNPRTGVCVVCGKKRKTNIHHHRYEFKTSEVKKNPLLALENTFEVCFNPCHRLANAVVLVDKYPEKVHRIRDLMVKNNV